jgi:hypothetical protein
MDKLGVLTFDHIVGPVVLKVREYGCHMAERNNPKEETWPLNGNYPSHSGVDMCIRLITKGG